MSPGASGTWCDGSITLVSLLKAVSPSASAKALGDPEGEAVPEQDWSQKSSLGPW